MMSNTNVSSSFIKKDKINNFLLIFLCFKGKKLILTGTFGFKILNTNKETSKTNNMCECVRVSHRPDAH